MKYFYSVKNCPIMDKIWNEDIRKQLIFKLTKLLSIRMNGLIISAEWHRKDSLDKCSTMHQRASMTVEDPDCVVVRSVWPEQASMPNP